MDYGNAILGMMPFTSNKTVFTRGEYMRNFDIDKNDGNVRNLQVATVDVKGKPLYILNHHGYWLLRNKAGDEETLRATRIIAKTIQQLSGPIILCGDFNLAPTSESIGIINDLLSNLSVVNKLSRTYTQLSPVNEVCDYIFVNGEIKVKSFKMSDELVSDHKALVMEFSL